MRFYVIYAVIALVTFVVEVLSIEWGGGFYYLSGFIWVASVIFSSLTIYCGIVNATRTDADKRGTAIASATIGAIVLFGLIGIVT